MATIERRGKKWRVQVRIKGVSRSKTFDNKAEAQQWALDFEAQLGKNPGMALGHSLREAFKRYALEISPTRKGARWEIIRLEKLSRDPIADIMIADIKKDDIQAWIDRQTTKPNSIHRELILMSSVFRESRQQWKWMMHNPMDGVRRPKKPPPRDRLISDDELKRILIALEYAEDQPIVTVRQVIAVGFLLAIETAMRQGELWGLEWDRVFLDRGFVVLLETKNGTKREVSLSKRAVELFKKLGAESAGKVFKYRQDRCEVLYRRAVQLAGIKDLTFHDTRHTAVTRLARKLDALPLARMVGHKDLRSLQIYYNEKAEDIAKLLD